MIRHHGVVATCLLLTTQLACAVPSPGAAVNSSGSTWYTEESLACFKTIADSISPSTATPPPRYFRLDVQRNRATGAVDSVVGTTGNPAFYKELPSGWRAVGDSVELIWTNLHWGLHVAATSESGRLSGIAQPITDLGSLAPYAFVAERSDCGDAGSVWFYSSMRGGGRSAEGN